MKNKIIIIVLICIGFAFNKISLNQLPEGFVNVQDVIPDLHVKLRYFSSHNFVGDTIDGYKANTLILTKSTAQALKQVHKELQSQNLCLMVYDGYRPQRAVYHFIRWAKDLNDTINKQEFYPKVEKHHLFRDGYISALSGHSRGSTVDLTIIDGITGEPLDMGSPYDFFGEQSWVEYQNITESQKQNRKLLQKVMIKHGFRNYPQEWWHFTLIGEPFPETYFDFVVE